MLSKLLSSTNSSSLITTLNARTFPSLHLLKNDFSSLPACIPVWCDIPSIPFKQNKSYTTSPLIVSDNCCQRLN
ncbi:hypothetical protein X975_24075, partial [Stegodyphus mimosarum]